MKWFGLMQSPKTLEVEARFLTPSGRVRTVQLSRVELLRLISDAAKALAKLEDESPRRSNA